MEPHELKLDSSFTKKFFEIPKTQSTHQVKIEFALPNEDIKDFKYFIEKEGKDAPPKEDKESELTFWEGVHGLINQLETWCNKNLSSLHIQKTLSELRLHFNYDGTHHPDYEMKLLALYKNGPRYLAGILAYLETPTHPLQFKKDVILQLLQSLEEEPCPPGCNLYLYDAFMQFQFDLPSQLMAFRKKMTEQVMVELLRENKLVSERDNVMEIHHVISASVYYREALGIGKEEKEDVYSQPVIGILNNNTQDKFETDIFKVARMIKEQFSIEISKCLTLSNLIEYLFELNIPTNPSTISVCLQTLLVNRRMEGYHYLEARETVEWLNQIMKHFGKETLLFQDVFKEISAEDEAEPRFLLHTEIILRNNLSLSLLERLSQQHYLNPHPIITIQSNQFYILEYQHPKLSYVKTPDGKISLLEYMIEELNIQSSLSFALFNDELFKNLNLPFQNELIEDIITFFLQQPDQRAYSQALSAFEYMLRKEPNYIMAFRLQTRTQLHFLQLAVQYGREHIFKSRDFSDNPYWPEALGIPQTLAANKHKLITTAAQLQQWKIVKLLLKQYRKLEISLDLINETLNEAMQANHITTIQDFLDSDYDTRSPLNHDVQTALTKILQDAKDDNILPEQKTYLHALLYVWGHNYDCSKGLSTLLPNLEKPYLLALHKLEFTEIPFLEYCFNQSCAKPAITLSNLCNPDDLSLSTSQQKTLITVIQNRSQLTDRLIALTKLYAKSHDEIYLTLTEMNQKHQYQLSEDPLFEFAQEKFGDCHSSQFFNYICVYLLPIIIYKKNTALLEKLLRTHPQIVTIINQTDEFVTRLNIEIQTKKSLDCLEILLSHNIKLDIGNSSALEAILVNKPNIAKYLYHNHNHAAHVSDLYADLPAELYLDKSLHFNAAVILDVCAHQKVTACENTLQPLINEMPDNLFNKLLLLTPREGTKTILLQLITPTLLGSITKKISHTTLAAILQETLGITIAHEELLDFTENFISKLLELYGHNLSVAELFRLSLNENNPALIRQICHWINRKHPYWNSQQFTTLQTKPEEAYIFFSNILTKLIELNTHDPIKASLAFFTQYPEKYFDWFIKDILKLNKQTCFELGSFHNNAVLLIILQHASPHMVEKLLRDHEFKTRMSTEILVCSYPNFVAIFKILVTKSLQIFNSFVYANTISKAIKEYGDTISLRSLNYIIFLYSYNSFVTINRTHFDCIYQLYLNATQTALCHDNKNMLSILNKLILKTSKHFGSNPASHHSWSLKLLRARILTRLNKMNIKELNSLQMAILPVALEEPFLSATERLWLCEFHLEYHPRNVSKQVEVIETLTQMAGNNDTHARHLLQTHLQKLLGTVINAEDYDNACERALHYLNEFQFMNDLTSQFKRAVISFVQGSNCCSTLFHFSPPKWLKKFVTFFKDEDNSHNHRLIYYLLKNCEESLINRFIQRIKLSPLENLQEIYAAAVTFDLKKQGHPENEIPQQLDVYFKNIGEDIHSAIMLDIQNSRLSCILPRIKS